MQSLSPGICRNGAWTSQSSQREFVISSTSPAPKLYHAPSPLGDHELTELRGWLALIAAWLLWRRPCASPNVIYRFPQTPLLRQVTIQTRSALRTLRGGRWSVGAVPLMVRDGTRRGWPVDRAGDAAPLSRETAVMIIC